MDTHLFLQSMCVALTAAACPLLLFNALCHGYLGLFHFVSCLFLIGHSSHLYASWASHFSSASHRVCSFSSFPWPSVPLFECKSLVSSRLPIWLILSLPPSPPSPSSSATNSPRANRSCHYFCKDLASSTTRKVMTLFHFISFHFISFLLAVTIASCPTVAVRSKKATF